MRIKKSLSEKSCVHNVPNTQDVLKWYDLHGRTLPWRAKNGEKTTPYRVWVSEIMLQQTTVATVGGYFLRFLERWPDIESLAHADLDDIFRVWAGLGYYKRARLLHACAQRLVRDYGGVFPKTEDELAKLPGIGPYTAAAITAIAFGEKANVVDGNVERIMARLYAVQEPFPAAKKKVRALAQRLVPSTRCGDYAQALMDIGATICTPRNPLCAKCPWKKVCCAFQKNTVAAFPKRAPKKNKPLLRCTAFVLTDGKGRVFLRRRPDHGILAGMMEVPTSAWQAQANVSFDGAPTQGPWTLLEGDIRHVFTHFSLVVRIAVARGCISGNMDGRWVLVGALAQEALPSLMRKILLHAGCGT